MALRVLVIDGHPDVAGNHYCHAVSEAYAESAFHAGHMVERIEIARLDLPYLLSSDDWRKPAQNPDIAEAQAKIARANHLVFVYPLWLGDMPAKLKSFLEQVSCEGFIMSVDKQGKWKQGLKGKSARIIVTTGMPAMVYRLWFLSHSLRSFERNILKFAGVSPVRSTVIGSVESSAEYRAEWLDKVQDLGRRGE